MCGLDYHKDKFLESMRVRNYSPKSLASYGQSLTTFFLFVKRQGIEDVREIESGLVRGYLVWLMEQPYTTWTRHVKLQVVRRFGEYLENAEVVLINPALGIALPKLEKRLPRNILTESEARQILDSVQTDTGIGKRDRAILEVFYTTGIRREEMLNLTVDDVDESDGIIRIREGKGAKDRVVPLGSRASQAVAQYKSEVRNGWVKGRMSEMALWLGAVDPHRPLSEQVFSLLVREYARKAGLTKKVTPHVWRHTCATHLIAQGADIAYAQKLLGHRSICTTQRYTWVTIPEVQHTARIRHPRYGVTRPVADPSLIRGRR